MTPQHVNVLNGLDRRWTDSSAGKAPAYRSRGTGSNPGLVCCIFSLPFTQVSKVCQVTGISRTDN